MEGFSMSAIRKKSGDLFTPDERAVLSEWFARTPPNSAKGIDDYDSGDASVASIVLRGRRYAGWFRCKDSKPDTTVMLLPQRLLSITWSPSGFGESWPVTYYLSSLPHYGRYVVTSSADCPLDFGNCDFAIGWFGIKTPVKKGAKQIICSDWEDQSASWGQQRWADLPETGLISAAEANAWADAIWPPARRRRR
jgi:hypothetical protein